jgi:hypothetical protein
MENMELSVDIAKNGSQNIGSVRFALRQGTNLFYASSFINGVNVTLGLDGLEEFDQSLNGVVETIGAVWTAQYPGTAPDFNRGPPIEFGLRFDGGLGSTATTGNRGPILDDFSVQVLYTVPELRMWTAPVGASLQWVPEDWVLESSPGLAPAAWAEVPGAASPHPISLADPQEFFRIRP